MLLIIVLLSLELASSILHYLLHSQDLYQPLRKLYLCGFDHISLDEYDLILREELNVKDIEYLSDTKSLCTPYLVLDFKVAGMTYKEKVNHVKDLLVNLNDSEMALLYSKYCSPKNLFIHK